MAVSTLEVRPHTVVELPAIALAAVSRNAPISNISIEEVDGCMIQMAHLREKLSAKNQLLQSESGETIVGMAIISGDIMSEDSVVEVIDGIPVSNEISLISELDGEADLCMSKCAEGQYIKERHVGPYSGLKGVYQHLIDEVAPSMGLAYNGGPVVELYYVIGVDDDKLVTEVCVPVS